MRAHGIVLFSLALVVALERENANLRGEVATLKGEATRKKEPVAKRTPREPGREGAAPQISGSEEAVSRRAMLGKAGVSAVAALAAGTLLAPRRAEAADGTFDHVSVESPNDLIAVFASIDSDSQPALYAVNDNSGAAIDGHSIEGTGVLGESLGSGSEGVLGLDR